MMHEAIIASLLEYTGQQNKLDAGVANQDKDEARMLKEVMHLSKLEEEKKQGKINLDFLKRKNQQKPDQAQMSSIIPAPSEATNQTPLKLSLNNNKVSPRKKEQSNIINVIPKNLLQKEEEKKVKVNTQTYQQSAAQLNPA